MPSFETVFELLFKYRPLVFEKGRLAFLAPSPAILLVALPLAVTALWSYRGARGKARAFDRGLLFAMRAAALALVAFCLMRPTLLLSTVVPQQSFVAVLVDDSKSLTIEDVGAPRSAFVAKQLSRDGALRRALEARFKLRSFRFADGAERVPGFEALRFSGASTDLVGALQRVRDELQSVPLAGIVLVSDGADNAGAPLSEALLALKARGIPVYTVGLGRARFAKDVEVVRVETPRAVLLGASLVATVTLSERGYGGKPARLLVEDEGRVVHTQDVALPAEGEAASVRVHVTAGDAGARRFRFRIAPLEGEQVAQNNQQDVLIDVADRREKLLYFEGEARFEPKFLRRAVEKDKNLQVVTLERTSKNKFLRLDVDDAEELAGGFPKTREELYRYRGLILGGVEASFFSADQLRMMADFVSQRGGGLMMLGSARSFGEGGYAGTPLGDVLPVVVESATQEPEARFASLKIEPTAYGQGHAITQIAASEEESAARWKKLPELTTVNDVRRTKPGALTLLTGAPAKGDSQVVLAFQRYGRGKALSFAVQDSWQWQMHAEIPVEDQTHENLWRQLLRFLVNDVSGPVVARVPQDIVAPGAAVLVSAEVGDDTYLRVNDARVAATVKDPAGRVRELPLEWTVEKDGEYRASFVAAEKGPYEVRVEARRGGKALGADVLHLRAEERPVEFYGAEMKQALLQRIANETGGRFYTPETAARLPEDLTYTESGATVVEQKDLWDMPAIFLAVLGLLSIEWLYRRARGLA